MKKFLLICSLFTAFVAQANIASFFPKRMEEQKTITQENSPLSYFKQDAFQIPVYYGNTRAEGNNVTLKINLEFDRDKMEPRSVVIMDNNSSVLSSLVGYPSEAKGFSLIIPEQFQETKQIVIFFIGKEYLFGSGPFYFLITEDVDLTHDNEINLNASDANRRISFDSYLPNGEVSKLPEWKFTDVGVDIIDEGNISNATIFNLLYFENEVFPDYLGVVSQMTVLESELGTFPGLAIGDVFINPVSNRWSILQNQDLSGSNFEKNYIINIFKNIGGEENLTAKNELNYYEINPEFISWSDSFYVHYNSLFYGFPNFGGYKYLTTNLLISIPDIELTDNLKPGTKLVLYDENALLIQSNYINFGPSDAYYLGAPINDYLCLTPLKYEENILIQTLIVPYYIRLMVYPPHSR